MFPLYDAISVPMCVLPYTYRKILRMLFKRTAGLWYNTWEQAPTACTVHYSMLDEWAVRGWENGTATTHRYIAPLFNGGWDPKS